MQEEVWKEKDQTIHAHIKEKQYISVWHDIRTSKKKQTNIYYSKSTKKLITRKKIIG